MALAPLLESLRKVLDLYIAPMLFEIFGNQDPLLRHRGPLKLFPLAVGVWLALLFYWLWYNTTTIRSDRRMGIH